MQNTTFALINNFDCSNPVHCSAPGLNRHQHIKFVGQPLGPHAIPVDCLQVHRLAIAPAEVLA